VAVKVALDTNAYTNFMRGDASCVQVVRSAAVIYLPLFVLAELRTGFAAGSQTSTNLANLQRFLNTPRVEVMLPDEGTANHYAQLYLYLRKHGTPIPTNDLWIAALVLQRNLILCTSDVHFQNIPQLPTC
jgi:tRNA(fMet)-specific endonuclease VapC